MTSKELLKIRKTPLFLSRYNRMMAMDGKNMHSLSDEDARLIKAYREDTNNVHYLVSVSGKGVISIRLKELEQEKG